MVVCFLVVIVIIDDRIDRYYRDRITTIAINHRGCIQSTHMPKLNIYN